MIRCSLHFDYFAMGIYQTTIAKKNPKYVFCIQGTIVWVVLTERQILHMLTDGSCLPYIPLLDTPADLLRKYFLARDYIYPFLFII